MKLVKVAVLINELLRVEKLGNISLSLSAEFARLQVILRRLMAVALLPYWSTWWRDWLELCLTI